ncbi:TPA: hypothetical protein ACH1VU_005054 [Pseudomonas aeruginosa]|nr:class I SAM-dependent methyltransferase [Pseudomonas aeruginosa]
MNINIGAQHWDSIGDLQQFIDNLAAQLLLERSADPDGWQVKAAQFANSETAAFMRQCPMTSHSFRQPRGYPGDATLLDYTYGIWHLLPRPDRLDGIGTSLYRWTSSRASATAVRWRRQHLANLIDEAADRKPSRARVLAVAAGHLREAELSDACQRGDLECMVALDQDQESLDEIERRYGGNFNLSTLCAPVRELIKGKVEVSGFDLIYAAGLFDYLTTVAASRLVEVLFAALNPGGKLVFANFMPGLKDAGYMEAVMNWWLTYRTPEAINQLAAGIAAHQISVRYQYADPVGVAGYLSLTRAS